MTDISTAEFETVQWSFDEETGIGRLVLDRPDSMNAMTGQTLAEIEAGIEAFEAMDREGDAISVRAVILEGAGDRAFCVGVDVDTIGGEQYPYTSASFRDALFTLEEYGAPTIAKIDGYCVGGGLELALMCDFRIASERSELGFPEIDLGIFPSAVGTTQRLPRLVGPSRAKELCMTGAFLSGTEAEADGLINAAHPAEDLESEVLAYAEQLAAKAPLAIRAIKDTINRSQEVSVSQGTEYEYQAYLPLLQTRDYEEGMAAFEEDRDPEFEGR